MGDIKQAESDSIEHESERLERRARIESDAPGMEHPLSKYELRWGQGGGGERGLLWKMGVFLESILLIVLDIYTDRHYSLGSP